MFQETPGWDQDRQPILRALARKGAVWTRPELVVDVEYRGWTDADQLLRIRASKGVRDDADR